MKKTWALIALLFTMQTAWSECIGDYGNVADVRENCAEDLSQIAGQLLHFSEIGPVNLTEFEGALSLDVKQYRLETSFFNRYGSFGLWCLIEAKKVEEKIIQTRLASSPQCVLFTEQGEVIQKHVIDIETTAINHHYQVLENQ